MNIINTPSIENTENVCHKGLSTIAVDIWFDMWRHSRISKYLYRLYFLNCNNIGEYGKNRIYKGTLS